MKDSEGIKWSNLYQASSKFKKISPWAWMANEDLFAVVNPKNGEVGYCSILGNGGQEFGLGVFLGAKGYSRFLDMLSDNAETEDFDDSIMTPMLSLLFANRQDLQRQDIAAIKSLGLEFHGIRSWPLFRSQKPGYAPWFLEKDEAIYLTMALEQALIVAAMVQKNGVDLHKMAQKDLIFTRFYYDGRWEDEWRKPETLNQDSSRNKDEVPATEEAELLLLSNSGRKKIGTWEVDIFILPTPIGPKSARPYFPLDFLVVDGKEGIVINNETTDPWLNSTQQRGVIIEILKNAKQLPRNIRVKSRKVEEIITPVVQRLNINLRTGPLPMLEQFKASLRDYLY